MTDRALRDLFWHPLCHRSELPNAGDFVKLRWLDDEVVLFNDGGDIVVFDNLCPHRGTRFFIDESGNGAISCPYHGWGYRAGALHVPCREQYDPQQLSGVRLGILPSEWCADFLFVSPKPQMSLQAQLGPTFDRLASISFDISGCSDRNSGLFECDWKVAVENALEPLHVPYVHAQTLGLLELGEDRNTLHEWTSEMHSAIGSAAALKKLRSIKRLFNVEDQYEGFHIICLFPFSMISTTFGYSYSLQNFFPGAEAHRTFFTSRLYRSAARNEAAAAALDTFFASTAQVNRRIFEEDQAICRRISPGFCGSGSGILGRDEEKIRHFRACLASAKDFS